MRAPTTRYWIVLALLGVAFAGWRGQAAAQGPAAGEGIDRGGALFQRHCAACHGSNGAGMAGTGVRGGPSLRDVDVAYVDLVLRTGRMPIADRSAGVPERRLSDEERQAVVRWMATVFELPGRIPQVGEGDAGRGQAAFIRNCAACHGTDAGGGITGRGARAPSLEGIGPVAIAEAIRVGPFAMPQFTPALVSDQEIADIAAFLQYAEQAPGTPLGLTEASHVGLAGFAGLLLLGAIGAIALARRAVDGRSEEDGPDHE